MPSQKINNYVKKNYKLQIDYSSYYDLTLANDANDYNEDVIFSNTIIGNDDGDLLPINIDLNSAWSNYKQVISWGDDLTGNTLISKNYYNPDNDDISLETATTVCDIGLVGTDNGLVDKMSGESITFTMGINNTELYNPKYYDRRFKMIPVKSFATTPNNRFSGNTDTIYNIVSKTGTSVGYYNELYGGFYQGFYKLHGYDYEVFPERVNKGWTAEFLLKPRQNEEYSIATGETYLNTVYPDNAGTFFFFGVRAENKYYHTANGSDTGYTYVTDGLEDCITTCACSDTGITNSNCLDVFPVTSTTVQHNIGGSCNSYNTTETNPPIDPAMDVYSNALSLRLSGSPVNPKICVKYIKYTGDCITTGTGTNTGYTYASGYTIEETTSTAGIYDDCDFNTTDCLTGGTNERWILISAVFERYESLLLDDECDNINWGGLGDIRQILYPSEINGASYNIIMPPQTHSTGEKEEQEYLIELNRKWLREKDKRLGTLKILLNGFPYITIEDFEEIIPRELNTQKEKQLGVPFTISLGGGTLGLRESLMFSGCSATDGPYIQDPVLMSEETLSATTYSGITSQMLLESNFAGTFMGGISQFRFYTEPLKSSQLQHNSRILKDRFDLYDKWCSSDCYDCLGRCYFDFTLEI